MPNQFPESHIVAKLLGDLIGASVELAAVEDRLALDRLVRPFACVCLDDAGQSVGAMVADLPAAVSLGGLLMMLPEPALHDQVKDRAPSEDVVGAVSEIFNNLTTTFNNVQGNPHIRSTPAKPASSVIASPQGLWIPKSSQRLDLAGDLLCGRGRLVLFWK